MATKELYCSALGKAIMAFLPGPELERISEEQSYKPRTQRSICTRENLIQNLHAVRERGNSINNEEYVLGLISIGAPLFAGQSGRVMGAISFDFSTAEYTLAYCEQNYSKELIKLSKKISAALPDY